MLALPIFPASHPASIVGADELNFCVRDGNRWTLIAINTNSNKICWKILFLKRVFNYSIEVWPYPYSTGIRAYTLKTEQE